MHIAYILYHFFATFKLLSFSCKTSFHVCGLPKYFIDFSFLFILQSGREGEIERKKEREKEREKERKRGREKESKRERAQESKREKEKERRRLREKERKKEREKERKRERGIDAQCPDWKNCHYNQYGLNELNLLQATAFILNAAYYIKDTGI